MFSLSTIPSPTIRRLYHASCRLKRALPLFLSKVPAGFPWQADDYLEGELDLNELLIQHPAATFYVRLSGNSMIKAGLFDGDILVVDRAVKARHRHIVVAVVDGEMTVKRLYSLGGCVKLQSENPAFEPILIVEGRELVIWGVVIGSVRQFKA